MYNITLEYVITLHYTAIYLFVSFFFYSEELILKESDLAIDVSVIVAREFISQWFGGLITFKWWSDLWVHEGFLGYFSNIVAANVSKLYVLILNLSK